jgi:hypothetical protein
MSANIDKSPAGRAIGTADRRKNLVLLMTGLSLLMGEHEISGPTLDALTKAKNEPILKLVLDLNALLARTPVLPHGLARAIDALLKDVDSQPNRGVWKPWKGGGLPHDFTALAIWRNRDNPDYIRDIFRDKQGGAVRPPFHKTLATEHDALEWLAKNTTLELKLQERLGELRAEYEKRREELRAEASIIKTTAKELLADYKSNEVRADGQYKGKVVEVTGVVGAVRDTMLGGISVDLGTGKRWEFQFVSCFVSRDQAKVVAQLNKGERVKVRGRVTGLVMNVRVEDCRLVSTGG